MQSCTYANNVTRSVKHFFLGKSPNSVVLQRMYAKRITASVCKQLYDFNFMMVLFWLTVFIAL